jgi:hypothetical protein
LPINLRKETVDEFLKLAESHRERQRLKYAIVKSAGMSSSRARDLYGFNDMSSKISEVESALEESATIRDAIENIAEVKDQAILRSLAIYDTTTESEDEGETSDGSETDSDIPGDDEDILFTVDAATNMDKPQMMQLEQSGKQESADTEETETSSLEDQQLFDILCCCDLNSGADPVVLLTDALNLALVGGSGVSEILKSRTSEMRFPAFCGSFSLKFTHQNRNVICWIFGGKT